MSEQVKKLQYQGYLMKQMRELVGELKDHASLPQGSQTLAGDGEPARCLECGGPGHFRKENEY
jgi:hypothetical protein